MKKTFLITGIVWMILSFSGCSGCSNRTSDTSYLDGSDYSEETYENSADNTYNEPQTYAGSVNIPYTEQYGNTVTIPVKINGMGLDMIFDTGASATMITLAEAQYLYRKGTLTQDDILDIQRFQTADGGIMEGLRINLREVSIGDKITLQDVEAVVVENQRAPLLLGQSVMKQFKEISVDRENKVVKFFE